MDLIRYKSHQVYFRCRYRMTHYIIAAVQDTIVSALTNVYLLIDLLLSYYSLFEQHAKIRTCIVLVMFPQLSGRQNVPVRELLDGY
jgi:hypothetical protein